MTGERGSPKILVMHYTAGSNPSGDIAALTGPVEVSSHDLVGPDGRIWKLVDSSKRAWHAGLAYWGGIKDLNTWSLGIEQTGLGYWREELKIDRPGLPNVEGSDLYWYPFPVEQMQSSFQLALGYVQNFGIRPYNVVGHSDIAIGRKVDPGPMFPWKAFAKGGVGAFADMDREILLWGGNQVHLDYLDLDAVPAGDKTSWTIQHLAKYGYGIEQSDTPEHQKRCVTAFQMHYRPLNINGLVDDETARIANILSVARGSL